MAPLKDSYSEALPVKLRRKRTVFKCLYAKFMQKSMLRVFSEPLKAVSELGFIFVVTFAKVRPQNKKTRYCFGCDHS